MSLSGGLQVLLVTVLLSCGATTDQERLLHREKRQFGISFGFPNNFNQFGVPPPSTGNCGTGNGGCEQGCQQQGGFTRCFCNAGFVLNRDRRTCSDINECVFGNAGCNHICNNTPGSFQCSCANGFTLQGDGRSCRPGQAPTARPPGGGGRPTASCAINNGGCEQLCRTRPNGLVRCRCRQGFTLNPDGLTCSGPGGAPGGPGSPAPITQSCDVQNGGCAQLCQQTFQGVRCGCQNGYNLQNDRRSCTDVNECQFSNGGCTDICNNAPGSYSCACSSGQLLQDGFTCLAAPAPTQPPIVQPPFTPTGTCGVNNNKRINMNTRIVGGKPSNPRDWPWMVALLQVRNSGQFCGGALITSRHVLTAAHCVNQFTAAEIRCRVGEYDFSLTTDNRPSDFNIASIKAHEQYNTNTQENDIAILRLERDVPFNEFVQPACLPPPDNMDLAGLNAIVTGWGTTSFGGSVSNVLREVQIPIWTSQECETAYPGKVFPLMMCAGIRAGGADSCQGDSGGPLVTQYPGSSTWYVVGVVSWGIECARADRPGVYTRVNQYLPWIAQNSAN